MLGQNVYWCPQIYGLVVSVLISGKCKCIFCHLHAPFYLPPFSTILKPTPCAVLVQMTLYSGFLQLGAGLSVGLAGLAAGFAIGIVGDAGVRGTAQQPRLFVGMVRVVCS